MSTKQPKPRKRRYSTVSIPQQPNQRNQAGRTGLDPMDNYRESGYIQGIILKHIFTGKLRTNNGYFLFIMVGLGILSSVTGVYAFIGTVEHSWSMALLCMIPMVALGLALLYNFGMNMLEMLQRSAIGKWWAKRHHQPKYRKSHVSKK